MDQEVRQVEQEARQVDQVDQEVDRRKHATLIMNAPVVCAINVKTTGVSTLAPQMAIVRKVSATPPPASA